MNEHNINWYRNSVFLFIEIHFLRRTHMNNIHIHVCICFHVFIHKHDTLAQYIALMWASRWGWTSVVGLLLSHHANADLQNVSSATPAFCTV